MQFPQPGRIQRPKQRAWLALWEDFVKAGTEPKMCAVDFLMTSVLLTDRAPALTSGLWSLHQTADIIQKHHGNL